MSVTSLLTRSSSIAQPGDLCGPLDDRTQCFGIQRPKLVDQPVQPGQVRVLGQRLEKLRTHGDQRLYGTTQCGSQCRDELGPLRGLGHGEQLLELVDDEQQFALAALAGSEQHIGRYAVQPVASQSGAQCGHVERDLPCPDQGGEGAHQPVERVGARHDRVQLQPIGVSGDPRQ